jgi:hypothetical protein
MRVPLRISLLGIERLNAAQQSGLIVTEDGRQFCFCMRSKGYELRRIEP